MAKFLKWCCGGCLVLGVVAGIAVFLMLRWAKQQPTNWTAQSTIEIAATPEEVLPLLEDLRRWNQWSRFERDRSEQIDREFGGPERGVGATVLWTRPRGGSDTPLALGKLELTAAGEQGLEYTSWHYGSLRFSSVDRDGNVTTSNNVEIGGFDEDFEVPGRILLEPTTTGCRVTWSESVELGDSLISRFLAMTVAKVARLAHETLLAQSLEGLKNLSELR